MRFIHTADVHLSVADKAYTLTVLAEIGTIAVRERAELILFAGDVFDTFTDAVALRTDVAAWAAALPEPIRVLMLPGNHEDIHRGANQLAGLSFGSRVHAATTMPFEILTHGDVEFVLFPFRSGFFDIAAMAVPERRAAVRVAVLHGTVAGMSWTGAYSEETEDSPIDPSVFAQLDAAYVALGHIHGARTSRSGASLIAYPGSARVWRKGEAGPRTVLVVDTATQVSATPVTVTAAGEYRGHIIPLGLDGLSDDVDRLAAGWGTADMVHLTLTGMVDDEHAVVAFEATLRERYAQRVRDLEITRDVTPVAGIARHPAAVQFLHHLAARAGDPAITPEVRERARRVGLEAIAQRMEEAS